jgi:hypothetical protein
VVQGLKKWWKKMRPRSRQWLYCFIAEIFVIGALAAQYSTFEVSIRHSLKSLVSHASPYGPALPPS